MINRLIAQELPVRPEVGMGATALLWTDRHAGTITRIVELGGKVTAVYWREDNAELVSGSIFSEGQEYEYSANEAAPEIVYTLRKDGTYVRQGDALKNGQRLWIGVRQSYRDPSF